MIHFQVIHFQLHAISYKPPTSSVYDIVVNYLLVAYVMSLTVRW